MSFEPRFALSVGAFVEALAAGVFFADDFFTADFFDVRAPTGRADPPVASPASVSDAVSSTTERKCRPTFSRGPRVIRVAPAPEPTHAIAAAVREAMACRESGEEKIILTALCGHGHLALAAYEKFLAGEMVDYDLSDEAVAAAMAEVPVIAG